MGRSDPPAFVPKQVMFEEASLEYPLGKQLLSQFRSMNVPVTMIGSHNRVPAVRGLTPRAAYVGAKRTLVVGVRRSEEFQTCKPSAHYQLPLATSCPGTCTYCYLMTSLGRRPYIRVYVNIDDILGRAHNHIKDRLPEETLFEGSATSDPVPVERYTGSLRRAIEFFGEQSHARFRFVTKFGDIDSFLDARHNGRTEVRFSVNSQHVISRYEVGAAGLETRLHAAVKVAQAGYPTGFMIAPIILEGEWREQYEEMFKRLQDAARDEPRLEAATLELVTHRYTKSAKARIEEVFPGCGLEMNEETRRFKFGQFGYGKYVYPAETMRHIEDTMRRLQQTYLPQSSWLYLV